MLPTQAAEVRTSLSLFALNPTQDRLHTSHAAFGSDLISGPKLGTSNQAFTPVKTHACPARRPSSLLKLPWQSADSLVCTMK